MSAVTERQKNDILQLNQALRAQTHELKVLEEKIELCKEVKNSLQTNSQIEVANYYA